MSGSGYYLQSAAITQYDMDEPKTLHMQLIFQQGNTLIPSNNKTFVNMVDMMCRSFGFTGF